MVDIYHVKDKTPYHDDVERLLDRNRSDFIPYGRYADGDAPDGIDPEFFCNYRKPEEEMLIAKVEGEVVGFVCFEPECTRDDYPVESPYTLLSLVLVDGKYRGRGIGRRLNERALKMHQDGELGEPLVMGTWESNNRQRHLVEMLGFEMFARRPDHRPNGDATVYYEYPSGTVDQSEST